MSNDWRERALDSLAIDERDQRTRRLLFRGLGLSVTLPPTRWVVLGGTIDIDVITSPFATVVGAAGVNANLTRYPGKRDRVPCRRCVVVMPSTS